MGLREPPLVDIVDKMEALAPLNMETGRIKESHTGILSHLRAKLRDWAIGQAGTDCYSWAALPSNDSKTRY